MGDVGTTVDTLDEIKAIVAKRVEVLVEQVTHGTRPQDLGAESLGSSSSFTTSRSNRNQRSDQTVR